MAKSPKAEMAKLEPETMKVEAPADYAERGWLYFSRKKFDLAIEDFRHVTESDANAIDSWYGLGLTLKANGSPEQAVTAFDHILAALNQIEDRQRASVLSRLVKGHLNQIKTGDWNLEKEVWKSV
jgi:tetratricopeptide (TPR) repeat protein